MSSEVNSLSNQAEKILDGINDAPTVAVANTWIDRAAVLAELAKAHALVDLADAIREQFNVHINRP